MIITFNVLIVLQELYLSTEPYDPEGALGSLTSAFLTFLGLQAGKIITVHADHIEREKRLISWGLILVTRLLYGIIEKRVWLLV